MKKKTTLQHLIELIKEIESRGITLTMNGVVTMLENSLPMEKEQIIYAFGIGCQVESKRLIGYQDIAEQHYNETYGSDETIQ